MSINTNDLEKTDLFDDGLRFIGYFKNPLTGLELIKCLVELDYVDNPTYLRWKDRSRNNKGILISILYDVYERGFFKNYITPMPVFKEIFEEVFDNTLPLNSTDQIRRVPHFIDLDSSPFKVKKGYQKTQYPTQG